MLFIFAMEVRELHYLLYLSIVGLLNVLPTDCYKIKLVGPTRCSGRVEINHADTWGTVCDDYWNLLNAEVVCRELDCGTVLEAKRRAFFGEGDGRIWLDDVKCSGHETSLTKCQHLDFGDNNCGHGEDAGVICSDHVRLVNGTNRCSGRVEISHDGHWRKVCNSDWSKKEAQVVCNELDCGNPVENQDLTVFGEGLGMISVKTNCLGNESSIAQCKLEEYKQKCEDSTVICKNSNTLRLVNGTNKCSGRVEIYHEGQWGTICDDRWGMQEAEVVCRNMECGSPLAVKYRAYFGEGSEQVWLDDVECVGNEKSINSCQHRGYGENDCSHAEDAGVLCSEKVRLVNTTNRCSGPLEVFHDGQWGRICSSGWNMKEAVVVCNELFCGKPDLRQIHNFIGGHGQRAYTSSCSGTESSISDCPLRHNSDGCENVVVTCTGLPQLKLTNGTDKCSGRVEILHDGQWGTVCDDHWDIKDAEVVCRALDCGTVQAAKTSAFFGRGSGEIWLDDVECLGNETSLGHCQHSSYGDNNCGHSEDAGVVCSSTIRLLNGSDHCSGRVEVNRDGLWSPLYATNWGLNEAEVMCREMNCGDPIRATYENVENVGVRGYTVSCSGRELTIAQCSMREAVSTSHNRIGEAKVECSGAVKLVEGYSQCDGKVEFYHNNQWGTVCGESWDLMEASVVCRQLKCGHVHKVTQIPHLGHDSEKLWIDEISCRGRESSLTECAQRGFGDNTCNRTLVAGVVCSDSLAVRLVNSNDQCSGRLEILHAGQWGTVCERHWTMDKAEMVCNLLECGNASISSGGAQFGQGTGPIWDASDLCFDNGTSFKECSLKGFNSINCGHEEDVGIVCAEKLRLVNGRSDCSGRVELFHDGIWGTVCDDDWEISNAEVVCRQLGCGQPLSALKDAHFGKGSGPIWLDNVVCTGQESALTQCSHFDFGENNCGHGEDASVICLGTPPKPQIAMNPGPEVSFGDKIEISCTMMTEHLGGTFTLQKTSSSFKMERYSDNEATVFTIPKVDFSHQGSYHCSYRKRLATQTIAFPPGNSAELSVKVTLEQPTISLTSPNAMVMFSPENVEVKRGSRFSLTCSIQSKYPAGFFHLTKLNETAREPKPAFSHSIFFLAYFTFPSVNDHDQGDYSCVYTVNISTMFFTSVPSRPLQVMVTASSLPSAISGAVGGLLLLLLLFFVVYVVWRRREQSARAMVRFSNRIGDVIKKEKDEKEDGVLDGRDYNTLENEYGNGRSTEDRGADVASHQSVDRNATEDLTGRICYELEPLIHS